MPDLMILREIMAEIDNRGVSFRGYLSPAIVFGLCLCGCDVETKKCPFGEVVGYRVTLKEALKV